MIDTIEKELEGLCEFVRTEKGITKISMEDLMDFVSEYELWKIRNQSSTMNIKKTIQKLQQKLDSLPKESGRCSSVKRKNILNKILKLKSKQMKKQYVIESKGFKEGVGSFKYSQKRKNEIKELKNKIK